MRFCPGRWVGICAIAIVSCQCARQTAAPPTSADLSSALQTAIKARTAPFVDSSERGRHAWQETQRFYKQNGYRLAWSDGMQTRGTLEGLITAVRAADQDGMQPADYRVDELDTERRAHDAATRSTSTCSASIYLRCPISVSV
jgi:hypothetical protein